jgi:hypothetical protein
MACDNKKVCIISGIFPLTGGYQVSREARFDEPGNAVIHSLSPCTLSGLITRSSLFSSGHDQQRFVSQATDGVNSSDEICTGG